MTPPLTCDYNFYNKSGTDANYRRLPIHTDTLDVCKEYLGGNITSGDYSKLHSGGYMCLPWCNTSNGKCSSDRVKLTPSGNWMVDGKGIDFSGHITRYTPKGEFTDTNNRCVSFTETDKTCLEVDPTCCGTGFASKKGENCDGLPQESIFYPSCYKSGILCCNHGKCDNGKCSCDEGYSPETNCCGCSPGYHLDNGNCVKDAVLCCDFNTGITSQVSPGGCSGSNKSPVNSTDDCYPKDRYYCLSDYSDCVKIGSPEVWDGIKDEPGILMDDYEKCFPPNTFYCDSDKKCEMGFLSFLNMNLNVKRNPLVFTLFVAFMIYLFLLFLQMNKRK